MKSSPILLHHKTCKVKIGFRMLSDKLQQIFDQDNFGAAILDDLRGEVVFGSADRCTQPKRVTRSGNPENHCPSFSRCERKFDQTGSYDKNAATGLPFNKQI